MPGSRHFGLFAAIAGVGAAAGILLMGGDRGFAVLVTVASLGLAAMGFQAPTFAGVPVAAAGLGFTAVVAALGRLSYGLLMLPAFVFWGAALVALPPPERS